MQAWLDGATRDQSVRRGCRSALICYAGSLCNLSFICRFGVCDASIRNTVTRHRRQLFLEHGATACAADCRYWRRRGLAQQRPARPKSGRATEPLVQMADACAGGVPGCLGWPQPAAMVTRSRHADGPPHDESDAFFDRSRPGRRRYVAQDAGGQRSNRSSARNFRREPGGVTQAKRVWVGTTHQPYRRSRTGRMGSRESRRVLPYPLSGAPPPHR